jgi:hypothetical protein
MSTVTRQLRERATNTEAAPISEREAMRRETETVRARVVADPAPVTDAHTPMTIDVAAMQAWLLRLAEERAVTRSPWVGWVD